MDDLWEVGVLEDSYVTIYSPLGIKRYDFEEFIKKYDPAFVRPSTGFRNYANETAKIKNQAISLFMSEGWEPYSSSNESSMISRVMFFRRKYQV